MKSRLWVLACAMVALVGVLHFSMQEVDAAVSPYAAAVQDEPETEATPHPAPLSYEGSETCLGCHDDKEHDFDGTGHSSVFFSELSPHGCETCHGPGSAHVEDPENVSMRLDRLSPAAQSATCQQCHDGGDQFFWEGSGHASRDLSCLTCHSVHSPQSADGQLKTVTAAETCYDCHKDVRAEMWKRSHHPVREGQVSCSDCHNPHGTQSEGMIRQASVNEQCYSCHADKRGPFLWEHAPVRESCLTCHTPHGSNHQKLQKAAVPFLCQQCHSNIRHPGTLYDGDNTASGSSPSNRVFNRGCINCHQSVHGTNHPSSPYLGH